MSEANKHNGFSIRRARPDEAQALAKLMYQVLLLSSPSLSRLRPALAPVDSHRVGAERLPRPRERKLDD